jgi:hypothetical protein
MTTQRLWTGSIGTKPALSITRRAVDVCVPVNHRSFVRVVGILCIDSHRFRLRPHHPARGCKWSMQCYTAKP